MNKPLSIALTPAGWRLIREPKIVAAEAEARSEDHFDTHRQLDSTDGHRSGDALELLSISRSRGGQTLETWGEVDEGQVEDELKKARAFIRHEVKNYDDAQDVISETQIAVHKRFSQPGDPVKSPGAYIFGIARRQVYAYLREKYRRLDGELTIDRDEEEFHAKYFQAVQGSVEPSRVVLGAAVQGQLWEIIRSACKTAHATALLMHLQEVSNREIAHLMGVTEDTVRTYQKRGRESIASYLLLPASDVIGGPSEVDRVIKALDDDPSLGEALTREEKEAVLGIKKRKVHLQSAAAKLMPHLRPDLYLLLVLLLSAGRHHGL